MSQKMSSTQQIHTPKSGNSNLAIQTKHIKEFCYKMNAHLSKAAVL
jgi:hypothetical protein